MRENADLAVPDPTTSHALEGSKLRLAQLQASLVNVGGDLGRTREIGRGGNERPSSVDWWDTARLALGSATNLA